MDTDGCLIFRAVAISSWAAGDPPQLAQALDILHQRAVAGVDALQPIGRKLGDNLVKTPAHLTSPAFRLSNDPVARQTAYPTQAAVNVAAIKSQLRGRGIRIVDAMGVYISILKQRGGAGPDGRHLSVEGNKKVAAALVGMVR